MNLNKAIIIGNLTRDPELRSLPSGTPVASFGIATNRFRVKEGQKMQDTQFHNIVLFGRLAEIAKQYLQKGSMAMIEGRIETRSWQGQDGAKKYRTEIIGEKLQLGPRLRDAQFRNESNTPQEKTDVGGAKEEELDTIEYPDEIESDDIPF